VVDVTEDVGGVDSAVAVSGELCLVWVVGEGRGGEDGTGGDEILF